MCVHFHIKVIVLQRPLLVNLYFYLVLRNHLFNFLKHDCTTKTICGQPIFVIQQQKVLCCFSNCTNYTAKTITGLPVFLFSLSEKYCSIDAAFLSFFRPQLPNHLLL